MADKTMMRRVVKASIIGATIEWYDFFLYGVIAGIVFNKLYFPSHDPVVSTMLAYATFAVGFITRPLGGVIFGHFGDKIGRKSMLVLTLMIMGGATVLIGFIPTYEQIGIWAPILLLTMRIFQGIGLGGEWGGAVLMTFETAPESERGYYASLPQMGLAIGLTLASGVVGGLSFMLSDAQFMAWGWRVAFILSILLVFVGMYIRLHIMESPEFQKVKNENAEVKIPIVEVLKNYTGNVMAGMGARYIDGVVFNVFAVFSISYLTSHLNVNRTDALMGVMVAALVMCIFIPYFGRLSDRMGRTTLYLYGSLIVGFSAFPAFWLMNASGGSTTIIWLSIIIPFGIFYAMVYGPEAALFSDLFDAKVRYTGISFVYQFSGIFASGLTPIIATALLAYGNIYWLCAYVAFAGVISAYSAYWLRCKQANEKAQQALDSNTNVA
ncbi:MFS transporter [Desulfotomaculum sp. 1211_IL3151]|uniref:MFS transporter n=1 Tax=Desulfotomaculum sp. 1211_IL3151 TaxID=3084055 RepID=UPI002FD89523